MPQMHDHAQHRQRGLRVIVNLAAIATLAIFMVVAHRYGPNTKDKK